MENKSKKKKLGQFVYPNFFGKYYLLNLFCFLQKIFLLNLWFHPPIRDVYGMLSKEVKDEKQKKKFKMICSN